MAGCTRCRDRAPAGSFASVSPRVFARDPFPPTTSETCSTRSPAPGYVKTFTVSRGDRTAVFDSFECAAQAMPGQSVRQYAPLVSCSPGHEGARSRSSKTTTLRCS
ncbi:hypothetical protein C5613_37585 [Rhodococcus opacus]|uniref:Uncharacterized protein n=1 Tax=Rhodococcus opacus TaxID=37919 RepID=A0A2S8IM90_RHOOP|nr:hypothetical protein C5613_37585 [Rhodococcus opacus]